jgi:hypothetical protein
VLVSVRTKSFMIQGELRTGGGRQSIRMKIAEVGEKNRRDARAKAKSLLGAIADSIDPRQKKQRAREQPKIRDVPTLREA